MILVMTEDDYPALLETFHNAKAAYAAAVRKARAKLEKAQAEYAQALICPEASAYETARAELTALRRWAAANQIPLKTSTTSEG